MPNFSFAIWTWRRSWAQEPIYFLLQEDGDVRPRQPLPRCPTCQQEPQGRRPAAGVGHLATGPDGNNQPPTDVQVQHQRQPRPAGRVGDLDRQPGPFRRSRVPFDARPRPIRPLRRRENGDRIPIIDLAVMSILLVCYPDVSAAGSSPSLPDSILVSNHNGTVHLVDIGQVVFSTKAALLHLTIEPYTLIDQVHNTLKSFLTNSNLIKNTQSPEIPLLRQILIAEAEATGHTLSEFRTALDNLIGITPRSPRMAEWLGLGLSVFNAGWSAYLSSQVFNVARTSSKIKVAVGQLQKTVVLQDRQIRTLAKSILQYQADAHETAEIMSAVKILSGISQQIHQYANELNFGVHNHRLPYSLFNPSDLKEAWLNLSDELNLQNLVPVFSDKPAQLYELDADYFMKNNTFHILLNVPVKDKTQLPMTIQQTLPSLVYLKDHLFLYQDPSHVASSTDTSISPIRTMIDQGEMASCKAYGTVFCCPKRIFPINKKSCPDEFSSGNQLPSKECLTKFTLMDPAKSYVIAKPQNIFNIYSPSPETANLLCPNQHPSAVSLDNLQEIRLPSGCTLITSQYRLLATSQVQFSPSVNADFHHTIDIAALLLKVPEIEAALDDAKNPMKQLLSSETLTLHDLVDDSHNTSLATYVSISASILVLILLTIIICMCRRKQQSQSSGSLPNDRINRQSASNRTVAHAARQIELNVL